MKNFITLSIIILIISVCFFSGCNEKTDEDRLIGTWTSSESFGDYTVTTKINFLSDKTITIIIYHGDDFTEGGGTWKIVDDKLVIQSTSPSVETRTYDDYSFSDDYKILELTFEGFTETFTKQ